MSAAASGAARFGLIALLTLALGALLLSPASPAGAQSGSGTVDYDTDGDNLIEVSTLAQLNAIRYDLDGNGTVTAGDQANYDIAFPNALASMGCAATCTGYELDADLDFDTHGNDDAVTIADTYWNGGAGWTPLGDSGPNPFRTTFEGNNHTISNLFINATGNYIGLFGRQGGGTVTRVHLVGAKVTGNDDVGALVGHITLGTVSHSSSSGTVSGVGNVGGLVGTINSRSGVVEYSRSSAVVTATGNRAGGLVGNGSGRVRVSYATGAVTGLNDVGGLAGYSPTSFYAVYATGAVTATGVSNAYAGGLIGTTEGGIYASYSTGAVTSASGDAAGMLHGSGSGATVADSYWDVTTTGIADDNNADTGEGKTTSELQSPTQTGGYAGIYANWDIDVDADSNVDDPWDFGTASEYPALKADSDGDGAATAYEFGRQGRSAPVVSAPGVTVDYDDDNDGLIEVSSIAQLNVIQHDLDGNGISSHADYRAAFPTSAAGMGCVVTDHDDNAATPDQPTCTGYELESDLDFDVNGDGSITAADGFPSHGLGSGWQPIGRVATNTPFTAIFEGNGFTISNMFGLRGTNDRGLFGKVSSTGVVRNVGLPDVDLTGGVWPVGALVAHLDGGLVENSWATGTVSGANYTGGLVGRSSGVIRVSYADVAVTSSGDYAGGLVGGLDGAGSVLASYATGAVTATGNHAGGLIGHWDGTGEVSYVYSTGTAAAASGAGGLIGTRTHSRQPRASYWDTQTSTQASSAGGVGKTTDDLQRPTDYTGIYLPWSVDIDDADGDGKPATGRDAVWDFGTSSQYPALRRRLDFGWYSHPGEMGLQGRDNSPASFGIPPWMLKTFTLYTVPDAAAGTAILPRLTYASDPNRDPLTYTLTGTDAASFELAVEEGFPTLKHKSGVVLTVRDYTVEVNVSDGKNAADGADASVDDTLTVTVTVGRYVNYDSDGDGLIEIDSLAKLNAMRWDTTGNGIPDDPTNGAAGYAAGFPNVFPTGCRAETCRGYELTANLNFNTDTGSDAGGAAVIDASDAYWNNGAGWDPIGPQSEAITMAEFKGNGHVIRNLFIDRGAEDFIGLFGYVGPNVDLLGVGLEDPNVKGRHQTGALAGRLEGRMTYVFVEGGSVEGSSYVGGLAGWLTAPPDALPSEPKTRIAASYASASVLGANLVGGLVGRANNGAVIVASYAAGTATCECTGVSGLVGAAHDAVIVASYSLSGVDGGGDGRGLVANSESDNTVTDSYWNTLTSGKRDTGAANVGQGKTTAELQTPTDYAGIYADWDVDLDNDDDNDFQTGVDNPWDFGDAGQYPALEVDFNSDGDATINEFGRQRRAAAANRAPVFTEGASAARRVKTGTATGTAFGAPIAARDPDGDTLVYALGGTDAAHFAINSSSGQLSTDGVLDMSAKDSYTVTVSVHDGLNAGGIADTTVDATITVTINVAPLNSPPVFDYGATYDINAVENRTSLGVIPATDPDGDALTYAIDATTGDHGDFEMDGGTLQFKTAPDFEAKASYTVVVTVRDSKNAAGVDDTAVDARITVTVTVLDVDEPPGPVTGLMAFGKDTAIDVEWTAPDMAGKPPVTGYTVQHRQWVVTNSAGAWGAWQDHVHAGAAVTATITGLTNGDIYLVGVRAANAEGASAWRQSVMATPAPPTDYDADNDGLIDAGDYHALYGIRWDLDGDGAADQNADRGMYAYYYPNPVAGMGCPSSACTGYELTGDIDFPHLAEPWEPIGDASAKFSATFDGKAHTISGLRIARPSDTHNGLFGASSSASVLRNVGLLSVDVAGGGYTGALAGLAEGTVESVYVAGAVAGAGDVGGLVGALAAGGSITRSYAEAAVTGTGDGVGGLAGSTAGGGSVKASYATGAVSGVNNVGGLIGANGVTVTAAYSTGSGGRLVGANTGTITHSYWDVTTSGQADDSDAATGVGKTTADLQTPTGYTGIYANWNLDLDGDANTDDDPWDFGSNAMYPAIKTDFNGDNTPSAFEFGGQGRSANAAPAFTEGAGPVDRSVPENTETLADKTFGVPVGATDANTRDTLTYTLGGTDAAHFGIVASSGQLQAKGALNFEGGTTSYQVVVSVADGRDAVGNAEVSPVVDASITVNISVTNVNEAPAFTPKTQTLTPNEEQTAAGTVVAAVDPDAGATMTYEMMTGAGDGDHALFTFVPGTRVLTFKAAPNYEASPTKTSFTVSIRVRDSLNAAGTADILWDDTVVVTINLQPVNEKPVFTPKTQTLTPNEEQTAAGTVVAAVDPDAGATMTYEMMTGAGDGDHALFTFVPGTRILTFKAAPNYEASPTKTTFTVSIRVRDSKDDAGTADTGWDDTIVVTINLQPVNEKPAFALKTQTLTPNEEQTAAGTVVAAVDPDAGATMTYEMMTGAGDGDHALFTFVPGTRALTFKAAPNYEASPTKTSFTVSIRVRDSLNAAGTADILWDDTVVVTINLQPVNEKPVFTPKTQTLTPNEEQTAAGTVVAAVDPDAGATMTYEMMTGASDGDHALFTFVPGTRVLTFKAAPNYEASPTKTSFTVSIRVRDSLNAAGTADILWDDTVVVTINLQPVNEKPAFALKTQTLTPNEEQTAAGTVVAAVDPDAGATMTYEMMTGAGDGDHALFTFVPGTRALTFKAAPNYEASPTKTSFTVSIQVRDSKDDAGTADTGWDDTIVVTINLQPVNEAPVFTPKTQTLTPNEEQTAAGTVVAAVDPDAGATMTYEMMTGASDGDHALFTFVPGTRALTFKAAPNYEASPTKTSFTVSIQVRDSKDDAGTADTGWDDTVVVTINLQDVNEAPVFPGTTATRRVAENAGANANVGLPVTATDVDAGDTPEYALSGADAGSFTINAGTGQITADATMDHEAGKNTFAVTVTATDDGGLTDTIAVTIEVTDVNEAPEFMSAATVDADGNPVPPAPIATATRSFREDAAAGTAIGAPVAATDPDTEVDPLDTLTYALAASGDHASFAIDTATGQLKTKAGVTYDYEAKDTYTVTVTVQDGKNALGAADAAVDDTIVVTINVTDARERWTPPTNMHIDVVTLAHRIRVSWTAPAAADNTGKPALTGYKVQWRQKRTASSAWAPDWVDFPRSGLGVTTDITTHTVTADDGTTTTYIVATGGGRIFEVRVCSLNTDGAKSADSPKAEQCGSWTGNALPAFTEGTKASRSVAENTAANTDIGLPVGAADSDAGDTLVYSMTTGTHSGKFTIDSATGQLKTKDPLDHETAGSYDVYVKVNDGNNGIDGIMVTITVTDVNEPAAFDDGAGPTPRSVSESAAAGDAIGDPVEATDPDTKADPNDPLKTIPKDTLTYALDTTTGDHAHFDIDTGTGQLKVKGALDYKTKSSYTVTVQVRDSLNDAGTVDTAWDDTIVVNISVDDVNEAPAFTPKTQTLTPNEEQTAAGTVNPAVDPDAGATMTYEMMTGAGDGDHALFTFVPGTRVLTFKAAPNYEASPTKTTFTVSIQVRDSLNDAGTVDTAWDDTIVVTINLQPVNEAPAFAADADTTPAVAEGATAVGTYAATDPEGDTLTYGLSGTDADAFAISTSGVLTLKVAADHETQPSYSVNVRVRDSKNAAGVADTAWDTTLALTVTVTDALEPPEAPTNVGAAGIVNGLRVTWTEPVMAGKPGLEGYDVEYALRTSADGVTPVWGPASPSAIGVVTTYDILNLAPLSTYRVRVRAKNDEGPGDWSPYVTGVPTVPPLVNAVPSFDEGADTTRSVAENTPVGDTIGNPIAATDTDAGDTLVYAIDATTGDHAHFTIDSGTGQLRAKGALDYESGTTSYAITVTVADGNGGTDSIAVTIEVTDVNEAPEFMSATTTDADGNPVPPAPIATATRSFREDAAADAAIGAPVAATDPDTEVDPLDTLTYALAASGDYASFAIDTATGQLKTKAGVTYDYEAKDTYTVTVQVRDSLNDAGDADTAWDTTLALTVRVTDALEPPEAPTGVGADGIANGLRVTWTAADVTNRPTLQSYDVEHSLRTSADGVNPVTWGNPVTITIGVVETHEIPGLTAGETYRVRVRAKNAEGISGWSSYDTGVPTMPPLVNADPTFGEGADTSRSVPENTAAGTAIGNPIAATDTDASDTLVYAIDATTGDHGHFAIDSTNGQLKVKSALDYESNNRYTVVVTVSDGNGGTDSITVTIDVDDVVNEAPVVVPPQANVAPSFDEGASASRNVAENTPAGRNIGSSVGATDHDNDVLRYKLEATGDHGHFAIDSSSGQLKTKGALDYESKSSYAVTVIVWDGNGGTDSIPVTIRVTNVDEAPTVTPTPVAPTGTLAFDKVGVARRTVDAYAPVGTAVGAPVTATVSAGMAGPFYSVYTRSSPFTVDRLTGQLRTARKLGPADEYTIQLLATDGKGRLDVIGVIITVTGGRANRDPVFREGASATRSVVAGSSRGVRVGRPVTATDPDGDALFYMVSGTDSSHFSIGSGSGQIKVGRPLTKSSYSFEVVVGDLEGGVDVLDITITVTAVDAPPVATTPTPTPNRAPSFDEGAGASRSVAENTPAGRNIGLPLAATDPDSDPLTYALSGTDSGHFVLSGNRLRTSGALDYEGVKNSYAVTVTVSDGRGGTDSIDVTVTVINVDEAPVEPTPQANRAPSFDEGASASRSVAENTPAGTDIGLPLAATDPDGDSLTYALSGTDSGHFALSGNQLRTSGDYAGVKSSYSVTVYVSDGRGGTDSIDVTVTVINVDEAPVEPTPQANRAPSFDEGASAGRSVAENTPAGTDIGLPLAATDPDSDSLTYALGGTDSGHFALSGNQLRTSGALDYEGQNSYSVTVNVSDGNGGSDTTAVTITVTNVNEPPGALPGLAVFEEVNGIRVSWSAPDMTGKPPITGYDVQYKLVTATDWNNHSHSGTGTTIQGLTAGSTYNVRVRAKNDEGHSVWASAQATPTAPTAPPVTPVPPGAITNLEVTPGWSKLGLTWNMPDMTGKPPITHFEVQYKLSIDKYWLDFPHDSTVSRVTIDFLGGGLSYDVRVRAVNSAGSSDWVSSSGTTK